MSQVKDALNNSLDCLSQDLIYCKAQLGYIDNRIREMGKYDTSGININNELNEIKDQLDTIYFSDLKAIKQIVNNLKGQGSFSQLEYQQLNGKRLTIVKDLNALQSELKDLKSRLKQKNLFAYLIDNINCAIETVTELIYAVGDLAFDALVNKKIGGSNPIGFLPFF